MGGRRCTPTDDRLTGTFAHIESFIIPIGDAPVFRQWSEFVVPMTPDTAASSLRASTPAGLPSVVFTHLGEVN